MKCEVNAGGTTVSAIGRRLKKQTAKKLAALRVLRQLKELGHIYVPFHEREKASRATTDDNQRMKVDVSGMSKVGVSTFLY